MTKDNLTIRQAAVDLLRRGDATLSEIGRLAGVGRQLVYYWAKAANIDPNSTREKRLAVLWKKANK